MVMTTDLADEGPSPRWRRIKRATIATLILGPLLLAVGAWCYSRHAAGSKLREAIADADRLDPGWRLAEIVAKRAVVPDDQNSAIQVQKAIAKIPEDWLKPAPPKPEGEPSGTPRGGVLLAQLTDLPLEVQLDAAQIEGVREELGDLADALAEARKLTDMPRGRPELVYSRNVLETPLVHAQKSRSVARLLALDVMSRARTATSTAPSIPAARS